MEREERGTDYGCRFDYKAINVASADEREQMKSGMKLCETFDLSQVNHKPTRHSNTLDTFFTSDTVLFTDLKVNMISTSHHNITEVSTVSCMKVQEKPWDAAEQDVCGLNDLNFHSDKIGPYS